VRLQFLKLFLTVCKKLTARAIFGFGGTNLEKRMNEVLEISACVVIRGKRKKVVKSFTYNEEKPEFYAILFSEKHTLHLKIECHEGVFCIQGGRNVQALQHSDKKLDEVVLLLEHENQGKKVHVKAAKPPVTVPIHFKVLVKDE
jgi:hypothetical protein